MRPESSMTDRNVFAVLMTHVGDVWLVTNYLSDEILMVEKMSTKELIGFTLFAL